MIPFEERLYYKDYNKWTKFKCELPVLRDNIPKLMLGLNSMCPGFYTLYGVKMPAGNRENENST